MAMNNFGEKVNFLWSIHLAKINHRDPLNMQDTIEWIILDTETDGP